MTILGRLLDGIMGLACPEPRRGGPKPPKPAPAAAPSAPEFEAARVGTDAGRIRYPALAQPKIKGMRLVAIFDGKGRVRLETSTGRPVLGLPTIAAELAGLGIRNLVLDGEAFGIDEHHTVSVAMRTVNLADDSAVVFHVFDAVHLAGREVHDCRELSRRLEWLSELRERPPVKLMPGRPVGNRAQVNAYLKECLAQGYEGVVVKDLDAPYGQKDAWIKLKPVHTYDCTIVGMTEGKGRLAGTLGALVVELDGAEFKVCGFEDWVRSKLWGERHKYLGCMVEVTAQELTKTGKLVSAQFVRMRPDKD